MVPTMGEIIKVGLVCDGCGLVVDHLTYVPVTDNPLVYNVDTKALCDVCKIKEIENWVSCKEKE